MLHCSSIMCIHSSEGNVLFLLQYVFNDVRVENLSVCTSYVQPCPRNINNVSSDYSSSCDSREASLAESFVLSIDTIMGHCGLATYVYLFLAIGVAETGTVMCLTSQLNDFCCPHRRRKVVDKSKNVLGRIDHCRNYYYYYLTKLVRTPYHTTISLDQLSTDLLLNIFRIITTFSRQKVPVCDAPASSTLNIYHYWSTQLRSRSL